MILTAGLAISKVAKSLSLITVPLIPALLTCVEQKLQDEMSTQTCKLFIYLINQLT
jgi:hypothetical protein